MMPLSDDTQTHIVEAYTSRYLDDLLNIDNPYFERMATQIYFTELISFILTLYYKFPFF